MAQTTATALITGASTGIGYELAKVFARERYDLVLVARDLEKLNEVAGELKEKYHVQAKAVAKDLSHSAAPRELYQEVTAAGITVGALVNNAGYGVSGDFLETDLNAELGMISLNMTALTHLTKLFLRDMVKQGSGRILNVASTAAFQPGPGMAVYCATKAYVLSFSEAVAHEIRGTGVTLTTLCPGATRTPFVVRAGMKESRLFKSGAMQPSAVAEAGYHALVQGKRIAVPGVSNAVLARSVGFLPRRWVTGLAGRILEKH